MTIDYTAKARATAKAQMPGVPADYLDSLPVDADPSQGATISQTGGWTMVLRDGDRALIEDGEFVVAVIGPWEACGLADIDLYRGDDWATALSHLQGNGNEEALAASEEKRYIAAAVRHLEDGEVLEGGRMCPDCSMQAPKYGPDHLVLLDTVIIGCAGTRTQKDSVSW
jgi:hypothetical protein